MKSISVFDLKKIPEIANYSIFEIISPNLDYLVNPFLYEMGWDVERGLIYKTAYHRTLDKEKKVGYLICGDVRTDREFLTSKWSSVEDLMITAGVEDQSLANELSKIQNYSQTSYGVDANEEDELKEYWQDEDETERIEEELRAMGILLDEIRGSQLKKNGSRKLAKDYHEPEPIEKKRKKWKRKTNKRELDN